VDVRGGAEAPAKWRGVHRLGHDEERGGQDAYPYDWTFDLTLFDGDGTELTSGQANAQSTGDVAVSELGEKSFEAGMVGTIDIFQQADDDVDPEAVASYEFSVACDSFAEDDAAYC